MTAPLQTLLDDLGPDADTLAVYDAFQTWNEHERHLTLYPAQEEALTALALGEHVILSTPTGSGKSLVAAGAHLFALHAGQRTVYTAPIKALVSEKFFDLVELFGARNVGMITGETSVNPGAPIVCCTAEILANLALRDPDAGNITQVVMDEFHFYADPDRGWAWQVPLLLMPHAQFLLMSATLGDVTEIAAGLTRDTGRGVERVTGVERPVPLSFTYVKTGVHETVESLLEAGTVPVYIVHFRQVAAVETAQALASIRTVSREERERIAAAIGDFRFSRGFGHTLSRLVRSGIGVHHAGLLPRYRRLVEQLAQQGLLKIICGTDTLGVGVNVPIRSVLLTGLTKFDGEKMRRLSVREFHQIAGRAGRAGYDTAGDVIVQAPEHEIENAKAAAKAAAQAAKRPGKTKRKPVKKQPPAGFVSWTDKAMEHLVAAQPEALTSRLRITVSMLLSVLARPGITVAEAIRTMRKLIFDSHEPRAAQYALARRALELFRTLKNGNFVTVTPRDGEELIELTVDLPENFALNQPLSPFAIAVCELLDPDSDSHYLDVISVVESTLEDPRPILRAQQQQARARAVAEMKAEGIEYEERMELLQEITHPQPLRELIEAAYTEYVAGVPWAADYRPHPKSVLRDMIENACNFRDYVSRYDLGRVEGVLLRYLSDVYRALEQTVPPAHRSDDFTQTLDWLRALIAQTDSSVLDEWERLAHPEQLTGHAADTGAPGARAADARAAATGIVDIAPPGSLTAHTAAFEVMVRNALFQRVEAAAYERYDRLAELDSEHGFRRRDWENALARYFDEYNSIGTGAAARSAALLTLTRDDPDFWHFEQLFDDPEGDRDWHMRGRVDLAASDAEGEPVIVVEAVEPRTG